MLSITHQDYRPANLRIWESKLATVWDFDMAVIDYSLYDVAFASLQFGGRECLFPEVSLDLAKQFVEAYIAATDKPEPIGERRHPPMVSNSSCPTTPAIELSHPGEDGVAAENCGLGLAESH